MAHEQQKLISHSFGGFKCKIKGCQIQYLVRAHFLVHRRLLVGVSHGERGRGTLWGLCCKGTNPLHKGPILMT